MDHAYIKTLIEALEASDLSELEFSKDGSSLRLVKRAKASMHAPPVSASHITTPALSLVPDLHGGIESSLPVRSAVAKIEVRASLFGVVHLQASPGAPAYIQIGQAIKQGQTLCVIEAMKIFNEICAEEDLVLDVIAITSGQEVEAGQLLFELHRSEANV
jgi:acetyl-CoA carboxylase biotin carboxyl carrier protein